MSRRGVIGVVAGAGTVMAALVVASTGRSPDLLSRPRSTVEASAPILGPASSATAGPENAGEAEGVKGWDPDGLLAALVQIVVVVIIIAVLVLLFLVLRDLFRRFAPHVQTQVDPSFLAPQVPQQLVEGAEAGLDALDQGEPRNAIVAAWVALESSAGAAGLPRHPYETSAEYVQRVLQVWAVDADALDRLAALYREARFSTHPLTEAHRSGAVTALRAIRADLGKTREIAAQAPGSSAAGTGGAGDPATANGSLS